MADDFSGPKKPKATFGDVMLGIPSGGRDDRGGRSEKGPKRERGGGSSGGGKPSAQPTAAKTLGEGGSETEIVERAKRDGDRSGQKRESEKRASGPMVVVKRASGVVETRGAGETPAPTPTPEASAAAEVPEVRPERPARPVTPVAKSALYEDVPESQSFAEMFEESAKDTPARKQLKIGEKVKGKIFQLGADTAFISLGGKSEAMIELRELKDDEGILRFGIGDEVEAHVLETGAKGILLTRTLSKGAASMSMLIEARNSGMVVEGMVLAANKGGLEVAVGDTRAFCPSSQIDVRFVEKTDQFIGEKLRFKVIEVRERNVVLSRRAVLEEEQKEVAAETRKKLHEGAVLKGRVVSVRDFGAFVDIGGIEAMLPVSELSHVRVGHPSDVVKVGDEVEVEVLKIEAANPNSPDKNKQKERITLSMRSRQANPFEEALKEITEGQRLKGKIVRLQPFGAFVELRPGVDGLIHISALANRRIAHPRDVVKQGDEVEVVVEKIDANERRIGLRRVLEDGTVAGEGTIAEREAAPRAEGGGAPAPRAARAQAGQVVVGKIDRIEPYGVFLSFPGGKGLVPASETGTERGTDMKRHFQLGQELKAQVLEIDPTGKIRLSLTAAARAEERADMEVWMKQNQPKGGGKSGLGTLADLLKAKLK